MTNDPYLEAKQFAEFLKSLSPEQIAHGNAVEKARAEEEYERFQVAHAKDECYLCGHPYKSFSATRPCPHWLLRPKGLKKKNLKEMAEEFGFFQIQAFLRWIANAEAFALNINDMPEEGSGTKLFELTIKYKNLKWSFSASPSDYAGHPTSLHANHPHYHLQMQVDGRPFVKFSELHLPFSRHDIRNIETERLLPDIYRRRNSHGEGMAHLITEETLPLLLSESVAATNPGESHFHIESFIEAEEGTTISGDDFAALIQEAKEKGVTVASLLHRIPNVRTKIVVSPGPAVVEQSIRTPRKGDA